MKIVQKSWTGLGLGAALAGTALLGACGGTDQGEGDEQARAARSEPMAAMPEQAAMPPLSVGGEGEGEGGEGEGTGGEGGVNVTVAATDPVVFRSALAITAAHIIAARDAYAIGETRAAAEMFAHPVSEVLYDMQPVLAARGVQNFDQLLIDASTAAIDGAEVSEIRRQADAILARLDAAALRAPDSEMSAAEIAAGVTADQISRAVDLYRGALANDAYEPYLDGYGYYRTAERAYAAEAETIRAERPELAGAIDAALELLADAYPSVERPETLGGDEGALAVAVAEILLEI